MIVKNGLVWNGKDFEKRNLYILNGKFVSKEYYKGSFIDDLGPVVDATGLFVMPGYVDAHAHIIGTGMKLITVDLEKENISKLINKVISPNEKFIIARGWEYLPDNQELSILNSVNKPVLLIRKCGHVAWINDFLKRKIKSEDNLIYEEKIDNIWAHLGDNSEEFYIKAFNNGINEFLRYGVTQVHSDDLHGISYNTLLNLLKTSKIRIFEKLCTTEPWNYEFGKFNNAIIGGIKLFADGSLGARTAYMFEPYIMESGVETNNSRFGVFILPENISEIILFAVEKSLQINIHTIGDKALHEVLNLLEKHRKHNNYKNVRLIHLQFVKREDFGKLSDYYLAVQPHFYFEDRELLKQIKYEMAYPFLEMYREGFQVAFSTDSPVSPADPKYVIENAIKLGFSREESIYLYTEAGSRMIDVKSGKIKEGYNADFCLYKNDPFENNPVEVYIAGNKVFDASEVFEAH
ncbi:MAG: amidohydrolase family protein [Fervidobacterium sp.]